MPQHETPKQREWQDIARDASWETNAEKLKDNTDELAAVMDSRREYFQHRDDNEKNSLPRSRDGLVKRLRRVLERARRRAA